MDFASAASAAEDPALSALFEQMVAAHHQVLSKRGFDPFHGRRLLSLLVGQGLEICPPAAGPVQTVRHRAPPGCRPHRRAGAARGAARQRPRCGGASGGECWGGRGRRGGVKRPVEFPIRSRSRPSPDGKSLC
jgi:hypothetical protein